MQMASSKAQWSQCAKGLLVVEPLQLVSGKKLLQHQMMMMMTPS
jgi:hypothetical protein